MEKNRRKLEMLVPTIIMGSLAFILLFIGYYQGQGQHLNGVKAGLKMIGEILPLLFFSFIVAGMVQVLLPRELLSRWIGAESGIRGIFIGSLAGAISPGGPYVNFPIVALFLRSGAGLGTTVAFITAWSLLAVSRLPLEIGIVGWKFALIRTVSTFFFPPIAGLIAHIFFANTIK